MFQLSEWYDSPPGSPASTTKYPARKIYQRRIAEATQHADVSLLYVTFLNVPRGSQIKNSIAVSLLPNDLRIYRWQAIPVEA
jgi:hypothetical protein